MEIQTDYSPFAERALAAYYRTKPGAQPPSHKVLQHTLPDGLTYIVIESDRRVLGVYRHREDTDRLRRLKRYPPLLDSITEGMPRKDTYRQNYAYILKDDIDAVVLYLKHMRDSLDVEGANFEVGALVTDERTFGEGALIGTPFFEGGALHVTFKDDVFLKFEWTGETQVIAEDDKNVSASFEGTFGVTGEMGQAHRIERFLETALKYLSQCFAHAAAGKYLKTRMRGQIERAARLPVTHRVSTNVLATMTDAEVRDWFDAFRDARDRDAHVAADHTSSYDDMMPSLSALVPPNMEGTDQEVDVAAIRRAAVADMMKCDGWLPVQEKW
jgi:hypothetical protein